MIIKVTKYSFRLMGLSTVALALFESDTVYHQYTVIVCSLPLSSYSVVVVSWVFVIPSVRSNTQLERLMLYHI